MHNSKRYPPILQRDKDPQNFCGTGLHTLVINRKIKKTSRRRESSSCREISSGQCTAGAADDSEMTHHDSASHMGARPVAPPEAHSLNKRSGRWRSIHSSTAAGVAEAASMPSAVSLSCSPH